MKKRSMRAMAMALSLLMVFTMTACGSKETPSAPATSAPAASAPAAPASDVSGNFVMGTGGVSGVWYPLGGAMCGAMTKDKLNITVQASGGSVENVRTMLSGERDLGLSSASIAYYGYEGINDFEGEDGSALRSLLAFAPMEMQFVVRADSGIKSLADLKGKSVGVGAIGSADEVTARELLGSVGLTYDDIDEQMLSVAEQVTAFKDRRLDAVFLTASAPTSGVLDAASQEKVTLIPIGGDDLDNFVTEYPYYFKTSVTPEQYSFLTEEVEVPGAMTVLMCTTNLSNEQVYAMLENFYANIDDVHAAHGSAANLTMETAVEGLPIPLHPGAEQFYKDNGVL